ncbi:hypothetical protein [Sphingomonas alpina]|uniref:EF-hand domain-containing protein n=1 Tax=Sphingomonas alpina TaxID=653931 RepID=A0A7H0LII6_9SPHN|nr:hypothetical protein [Sphingomonas alpina]QNQ09489.1 hypothetical protein H3Z74_23095 [Sphingomonas alpina]
MKSIFTAAAIAAGILATPLAAAPHDGRSFIADYDTNGDGQVTRAEFDAVRAERFIATDTNKDGWVSDSEYLAEYTARLEKQLAASDRSEEQKTEERQRQVRQTHVRFGVLDKDKDQKMQKAEYDVSGNRAFAGMDDDKNNVVTSTDIAAVSAKQAAREAARAASETPPAG